MPSAVTEEDRRLLKCLAEACVDAEGGVPPWYLYTGDLLHCDKAHLDQINQSLQRLEVAGLVEHRKDTLHFHLWSELVVNVPSVLWRPATIQSKEK